MIAIFLNEENRYLGYKPEVEEGETFDLPFLLYAELPDKLLNIPEGYCAKYSVELRAFQHEAIPAPPPVPKTPEQQEIEQLKARLSASDQLLADNSETTQFILEQLIANGVIV